MSIVRREVGREGEMEGGGERGPQKQELSTEGGVVIVNLAEGEERIPQQSYRQRGAWWLYDCLERTREVPYRLLDSAKE